MEYNNQAYRILYNWKAEQDEDITKDGPAFIRGNTVLLIWTVMAIVCAAIFLIFVLKWHLERRFNIRFCSGSGRERRMIASRDNFIASSQRRRDAAIAAEREKKLNEEEQKVEIERKRTLLSDFSTTVEEAHLECDPDGLGAMEEGNVRQQDANANDHAAILHIPGKDRTSAQCRICLSNIVVGESIICSPNPDCIHIYHGTCILSWLCESKAKSDCPCCRLPFIPEAYNDNEDNVNPNPGLNQGSSPDTGEDEGTGNDGEGREH